LTESKERSLVEQLTLESYHRFFYMAILIYPWAVLYLSAWVPLDQRTGYLIWRACIWLFLYAMGRRARQFPLRWLRTLTVLYVTLGLLGNAQLLSVGGPNLLTVLAHAAFVLLGFLETEPASAYLMGAALSLLWCLISVAVGSPVGFAASGLPFSLGLSVFMVHRRGSSLRNLANLLSQQERVNARLAQAVSLLGDCNALLKARVEEREAELKAARERLTGVQADLLLSHQEQSQLQEQWLQADRLETLERFGVGLSHSFSNAITCIWLGVAQLRARSSSAAVGAALDDMEEACDRSSQICRRMVLAQGTQVAIDRPFDVHHRLQESLGLLRKSVTNQIFLNNEGTFWVSGEPSLLDQVIWNLVLNAASACQPGDPIEITVRRISPEVGEIRVEDRGKGIEATVMPFVFEPFFTTKGPGQGHGLGLAIVKEGVDRLHGRCSLESKPGEGTTVKVELPIFERQSAETPAARPVSAATQSEGFKICLVEDQDTLRKLLATYLRKQSHDVVVASCAEEPVLSTEVQVLITDVTLPGMSGLQLANLWVAQHPGLKVIFISGFPFEGDSVQLNPGSWVFVPKPFRFSELSEQLTRLMNGF
jgi:signal transduction histidine kinase